MGHKMVWQEDSTENWHTHGCKPTLSGNHISLTIINKIIHNPSKKKKSSTSTIRKELIRCNPAPLESAQYDHKAILRQQWEKYTRRKLKFGRIKKPLPWSGLNSENLKYFYKQNWKIIKQALTGGIAMIGPGNMRPKWRSSFWDFSLILKQNNKFSQRWISLMLTTKVFMQRYLKCFTAITT
jgi:hypothetical protein